MAGSCPEAVDQLERVARTLESRFRDAQEFEFTIEDGALYLLQTRTAKRTPWAALRIAVEQVEAGLIDADAGARPSRERSISMASRR